MNTFSAVSQLPGWQHVQDYILDPHGYINRSQNIGATKTSPGDNIRPLQEQGKILLTQLCTRVAWLLRLRAAAPPTEKELVERELAAKAIVFYLASDKIWLADAAQFMKEAELRVTQLLTRNANRFAQFRELQKKGGKLISFTLIDSNPVFLSQSPGPIVQQYAATLRKPGLPSDP